MLLFLALACGDKDVDTVDSQPEPPAAAAPEVRPEVLDFGRVEAGESASETLTLVNPGDVSVMIADLQVGSDDLSLLASADSIGGDSTETVVVSWTPSVPGLLDDTLTFSLGASADAMQSWTVSLTGEAPGPLLTVSADAVDMGEVSVGCDEEVTLRLGNAGASPLTVSELELLPHADFTLVEALPELPLSLQAGESQELELRFTPQEEVDASTSLRVVSDDLSTPQLEIPVIASGRVEGDNTLSFEVTGDQNVTALLHVNEIAINGDFSQRFIQALPTLFAELDLHGVPYRVAAILNDDGVVTGSTPFVDNSFTNQDAADAIMGMLESGTFGDHDANFQALELGIAANRSWLLDESSPWTDSRLSLVGVNNDLEQSPRDYYSYVLAYRAFKQRTEDIVVSAIGGDPPWGCQGSDPFTAFFDAAELTGGVFLSICETDWTGHMESLAESLVGIQRSYELEGVPQRSSIQVWEDDSLRTSGWAYDPRENTVVFDEGEEPAPGSTLRVHYLYVVRCD